MPLEGGLIGVKDNMLGTRGKESALEIQVEGL